MNFRYIKPARLIDITRDHGPFESEIMHYISGLRLDRRAKDQFVKLAKAAFFAGRDQVIEELNTSDDQPDRLELEMCQCGHTTCTDVWFKNAGKFAQGSGFDLKEATRLQIGWDLAGPGGDRSVEVRSVVKDGKAYVTGIEDLTE